MKSQKLTQYLKLTKKKNNTNKNENTIFFICRKCFIRVEKLPDTEIYFCDNCKEYFNKEHIYIVNQKTNGIFGGE